MSLSPSTTNCSADTFICMETSLFWGTRCWAICFRAATRYRSFHHRCEGWPEPCSGIVAPQHPQLVQVNQLNLLRKAISIKRHQRVMARIERTAQGVFDNDDA